VEPPAQLWKRLGVAPPPGATFYRAKGCSTCNGTGYRGRMGLIEVLVVDERVRELIVTTAPLKELADYAVAHCGMVPLRVDGLRKAAQGLTTLEEILQATAEA
jgi:type IV pilus assembly protein PilB